MTLNPSQRHSPMLSGKNLRAAAWAVFGLGLFVVALDQAANWAYWIRQLERRWAFKDGAAAPPPKASVAARFKQPPGAPKLEFFPGVEKIPLADVKDGTPMTRAAEYDAFYGLFKLLEENPQQDLDAFAHQADAAVPINFSQLLRQLEYYRGRLVRFRGLAKSIFEQRVPKNDYKIEKYYQIWASTTDSNEVILVAALELPPGLETSKVHADGTYDLMDEPFEVVGFAYKRVVYNSVQQVTNTPMILAKTVGWHPAPKYVAPPPAKPEAIAGYLVATIVAAAVFVAAILIHLRMQAKADAANAVPLVEVHDWKWKPEEGAGAPPTGDDASRPPSPTG